ncbi:AraC family transcriptional regulator [Streptomyces maremycinicus]|uniref:AraC family transcriptional regulator n=1 Tax=Streptomyces maremycinicus TaxID=1679753 RepID=UPI0007897EB1|nr:AraC family transcriptional regulator [Streptomyces sp. NBRC 110468]
MDVLSDAVAAMRTGRPHSSRTAQTAPWGVRFPASQGAGFHVVLQGTAWLLRPGQAAPVALGSGDVVFLPHGYGHALADHPHTPLEDFALEPDGSWPVSPDPGPGLYDAHTVLLCGAYQLNRSRAHPLLSELPPVVHIRSGVGTHHGLRSALDLLGAELAHPHPGSDAIVSGLLDTLLVYLLRTWWLGTSAQGREAKGWAAALRDPAVTAALQAMHSDPALPWTVGGLASRAGLSRAAFARRFTALVGRPPLAYLTWVRMTAAGRLLRSGDTPLRAVAEHAGYTSEFAFAKAFKREYGIPPGKYRQRPAVAAGRREVSLDHRADRTKMPATCGPARR